MTTDILAGLDEGMAGKWNQVEDVPHGAFWVRGGPCADGDIWLAHSDERKRDDPSNDPLRPYWGLAPSHL